MHWFTPDTLSVALVHEILLGVATKQDPNKVAISDLIQSRLGHRNLDASCLVFVDGIADTSDPWGLRWVVQC